MEGQRDGPLEEGRRDGLEVRAVLLHEGGHRFLGDHFAVDPDALAEVLEVR